MATSTTRTERVARLMAAKGGVTLEPLEGRQMMAGDFGSVLTLGGDVYNAGTSVATDAAGNAYVVGMFSGRVDFDPSLATKTLDGFEYSGFAAKYDSRGRLQWAMKLGDIATDVAVDAAGNVAVSGTFSGTQDFDPGAGVRNLTSSGEDAFIVKLRRNGSLAWAQQANANLVSGGAGASVAIDRRGNVYATGNSNRDRDLSTSGAFVQKYASATGAVQWDGRYGGIGGGSLGASDLAVDSAGNVYTCGSFSQFGDFDPTAGSTYEVYGINDAYTLKLNTDGQFMWVKKLGGSGSASASGIAADAGGNLYITGQFNGTSNFDVDTFSPTGQLDAGIGDDAFLCRLSAPASGSPSWAPHQFSWARQIGGEGTASGVAVAVDRSGNAYVTGSFTGTADLDWASNRSVPVTALSRDVFFSKVSRTGATKFGGAFATSGDNWLGNSAGGIAVSSETGNVYCIGTFVGTTDFDPGTRVRNRTVTAAHSDIFLVRLTQPVG